MLVDLTSVTSEKKIDHIDRRLYGVVRLLEELKPHLPSPSAAPSRAVSSAAPATIASSSPASHVSPYGNHGSHSESASATVVEGESSLTAHSAFANDLLQKVVSRDAGPEMREGIEALRHMVETMKKQPAVSEMTYPHAKPVRPVALEGCELPPIDQTLTVLKLARCMCCGVLDDPPPVTAIC